MLCVVTFSIPENYAGLQRYSRLSTDRARHAGSKVGTEFVILSQMAPDLRPLSFGE